MAASGAPGVSGLTLGGLGCGGLGRGGLGRGALGRGGLGRLAGFGPTAGLRADPVPEPDLGFGADLGCGDLGFGAKKKKFRNGPKENYYIGNMYALDQYKRQ